ncbi:KHA1_1 [Sanghuangporus vaninii]
MGQFSEDFIFLAKRAAAEQAGIISGDNPAEYNANDPFRLWVIQAGIIIIFTQLLSVVLGRLRQPRVIAEVIGGVLLGPSVMGQIPGFSDNIFPSDSIPILNLTANVGLVFFLFLVGLEVDISMMKRNARAAFFISAIGLIIPLGLGAALAVPIYHEFVDSDVNYGHFILFVAVAVGITAFPVLCRILTETRLLDTPVGVVTLAAGVGNDIVGWILLALAVALVNSSTGLTALWVLLTGVGWVLFMLLPVKWAFRWLARKTGSLEGSHPSMLMMTITFLMVLVSAFFTDIIGIHAIFGGFLAGLVIPHDGGFAIALVEKLEDFVSLVFLPLYFAFSGLRTDLSLLDNGKTWGYVVFICVIAFVSKFFGCAVTAKLNGFSIRESGAIGTLMSCKGLVELIVLNVGFQAGILDTRLFSMFVLHAIVLTFITTPLTLLWYPESKRSRYGRDSKEKPVQLPPRDSNATQWPYDETMKTKFAVVLNRVEHLPAIMILTQLLQRHAPTKHTSFGSISESDEKAVEHSTPTVQLSALRLVELTERTSAVLRSQESAALAAADALLSVVRTCGRMYHLPVSGELSVVSSDGFSREVTSFVNEQAAHMVVIPWALRPTSASGPGAIEEQNVSFATPFPVGSYNPFEGFFSAASAVGSGSVVYSTFIRKVFSESPADVALVIDRESSSPDVSNATGDVDGHHLFLPFFGGPDDRLALELLVQLCTNPTVSATIIRIHVTEESVAEDAGVERMDTIEEEKSAALSNFTVAGSGTTSADTHYGAQTTQTRMQSDTADDLVWSRYASKNASSSPLPPSTLDALSRITFQTVSSSQPIRAALTRAAQVPETIIIVGRGRRLARESHRAELKRLLIASGHAARDAGAAGGEMSRTVGDVAAAFLLVPQGSTTTASTSASAPKPGAVFVVQAAFPRGQAV